MVTCNEDQYHSKASAAGRTNFEDYKMRSFPTKIVSFTLILGDKGLIYVAFWRQGEKVG